MNRMFGKTLICSLIIFIILFSLPLYEVCASKTCTVSYNKGINLADEPDNFIKGTVPHSVTVSAGDSIVAAKNTLSFRDYIFMFWKYTMNDSTHYVKQGETIDNITENITLIAVWYKKDGELTISANVSFTDGNSSVPQIVSTSVGKVITTPKEPSKPAGSYTFLGWKDNSGLVIPANSEYTVTNITTKFTALWSSDGSTVNYRKISVSCEGNGTSSPSNVFYALDGSTHTIEFTPEKGCHLTNIKVNDNSVAVTDSLVIKVNGADISVKAVFSDKSVPVVSSQSVEPSSASQSKEPSQSIESETEQSDSKSYTVSVEITGHGRVQPGENLTVVEGESLTLFFYPDQGCTLPHVIYDNGTAVSIASGNYSLNNINQNHTITIAFNSEELSQSSGTDSDTFNIVFDTIFILIASAMLTLIAILASRCLKTKKVTATEKKKK